MAAPSLAYHLADQLLGGNLVAELDRRRAQGSSYDAIARELAAELNLDAGSLSGETVRRWHLDRRASSAQ